MISDPEIGMSSADKVEAEQIRSFDYPLARALSPQERIAVEKRMKRKLDLRCSLFVLIYILSEEFRKIWNHWR